MLVKKNLTEQEQLVVIEKMKHKKKVIVIYLFLIALFFAGLIMSDVYSRYLTIDLASFFFFSLFPIFLAATIYLTFIFRCPNCDAIPKSGTSHYSIDGKGEIARETGMVRLNVDQCANCGAFLSMRAWRKHQQSKL